MKHDLRERLDFIRKQLKNGSIEAARHEVRALTQKKVPRGHLFELAELARVIRLPRVCLQLLRPVVRPSARSHAKPTNEEKAEYGVALSDIAAHHEGLKILEEVNPNELPYALIYRSWLLFRVWDHESAIPLLEQYLANARVPEVEKIGAKINLASALINGPGETVRSKALLEEVVKITEQPTHRFYYRYTQIHLAQVAFFEGDWARFTRLLDEFEKVCREHDDSYNLMRVCEWRGYGALKREPHNQKALKEMALLFEEARTQGLWDYARGVDYYAAEASQDKARLIHLYYGSPHSTMRAHMVRALGGRNQIPPFYEWKLGEGEETVVLDVGTGEHTRGKGRLKPGQSLHRLIAALTDDFYRPASLGYIHERLYAGEYYNSVSSPDRIHQVILRLREWFRQNKLPLAIAESEGFYQLKAAPGKVSCTLRLPDRATQGGLSQQTCQYLARLSAHFGDAYFSTGEASQCLAISRRSVNNFIKGALTSAQVEQSGAGPRCRYRVLK